jgi:hypothetical protein
MGKQTEDDKNLIESCPTYVHRFSFEVHDQHFRRKVKYLKYFEPVIIKVLF